MILKSLNVFSGIVIFFMIRIFKEKFAQVNKKTNFSEKKSFFYKKVNKVYFRSIKRGISPRYFAFLCLNKLFFCIFLKKRSKITIFPYFLYLPPSEPIPPIL